ncbi:hypothetical protein TWF730_009928 [Orbilia blumenaviensis]|uniref:Uncharacterized protein n=1 Tax=Orbilia blumenaviensis TaxID=1796055 RepID=A0AAV9UXD5_9PEZI
MSTPALQSSAFVCRSCSRHLRPCIPSSATRSFSTTASVDGPSTASPYSPYYVDIPFPPQRYAPWKPRAKGSRPEPRKVFRNDKDNKKITSNYLALVSKEPTVFSKPGKTAPAREKAYITWKERMADSRRRNIRDGLLQLHAEKSRRDQLIAQRSEEKQALRAKLLAEEDSEMVKLTTPTIISALQKSHPLTDPGREERLAEKRERYLKLESEKSAERLEELHELYIRAHEFIFTEAQLDQVINREFSSISEAEQVHMHPPDATQVVARQARTDIESQGFYLKDEIVFNAFADALTGGSRRTEQSKMTAEQALEEYAPDMTYTGYGYAGKKTGQSTAKATTDLFNIIP